MLIAFSIGRCRQVGLSPHVEARPKKKTAKKHAWSIPNLLITMFKCIVYSDTVSRSGVYCSVSIALEQCKVEGVVDVFQVTKAVKRSKPGAVTTLVM